MKRIVALCLTMACLISLAGCAGDTNMDEKKPNNTASAYALALASYPEMAPYPNEMEYFDEKTGEFDSDGFDAVLLGFFSSILVSPAQPIREIRQAIVRHSATTLFILHFLLSPQWYLCR